MRFSLINPWLNKEDKKMNQEGDFSTYNNQTRGQYEGVDLSWTKLKYHVDNYVKNRTHKHKVREAIVLIFLFFILLSTYYYKAHSATFSMSQSSWAGGFTNNSATHSTNQTNWTQFSTSTGVTTGGGDIGSIINKPLGGAVFIKCISYRYVCCRNIS